MSYMAIAVIVGSTVGTVRSRLHYAKRKLNEIINQRRNPTRLASSGDNHGEPQ
jgi:DNA-directed RNA polymerase specialized sigma24 family protein